MGSSPSHGYSSSPIEPDARVAAGLEYLGGGFCGWQRQANANLPSVQGEVEVALSRVADCPILVHCAGRTDAGVHADSQVIHFDPGVSRSSKAWVLGANMYLPDTVAIKWACAVSEDFHARFSATSRRYRFLIDNSPHRSALSSQVMLWQRAELDGGLMNEAGQHLLGERDFSAFRAAGCQSRTPMRKVEFVEVSRRGRIIVVDIQANAFLHHMVRNIVGSLMHVGLGKRPPDWMGELMESRDRTLAAATAQPQGLYLASVAYPDHFGLPSTALGPVFLPEQGLMPHTG